VALRQLKLITQQQGVFPDADAEGTYAHYGVSQQMNVYVEPGMPVDADGPGGGSNMERPPGIAPISWPPEPSCRSRRR